VIRRVVLGLGIAALATASCSGSSSSLPAVHRTTPKPGEIVTVLGAGKSGPYHRSYFGTAADKQGTLYATDENGNVLRVGVDGKVTRAARGADIFDPIVVDEAGTLYVAGGGRIRAISGNKQVTVAGTGRAGKPGPANGPALSVDLGDTRGLAIDRNGNVYFANGSIAVAKVSGDGTLTTIAGTDKGGFSGDGGPATAAQFNNVSALAVDGAGNIFVTDEQRIRRIDTHGIITTIAGTGAVGSSGDDGPATQATFNFPSGLAVDPAGDVFVSDEFNSRVRRIARDGIITSVVGNGARSFSGEGVPAIQASLDRPRGLAFDGALNLYIAELDNMRVRVVGALGRA